MKFTSFIRVVSLCFLSWGAFFQSSQAQCPSVAGTGDPAVIMLNLYGMPHAAFLNTPFEDLNGGVTAGVQLGAIFSPEFQLVSGAEMDWVKRSPASLGTSSIAFNYEAFILEIPLDLRMRFHKGRDQEAFFILGAGFVLANVKESNQKLPQTSCFGKPSTVVWVLSIPLPSTIPSISFGASLPR